MADTAGSRPSQYAGMLGSQWGDRPDQRRWLRKSIKWEMEAFTWRRKRHHFIPYPQKSSLWINYFDTLRGINKLTDCDVDDLLGTRLCHTPGAGQGRGPVGVVRSWPAAEVSGQGSLPWGHSLCRKPWNTGDKAKSPSRFESVVTVEYWLTDILKFRGFRWFLVLF